MGEALAKGLVIGLFLGIIGLIIYFIKWLKYKFRVKLLNEEEKYSFLEKKFKKLLNTKEGKKEIVNISVSQPLKSGESWTVYKTLKWGTWPINDKEEVEIVHTIFDTDLEKLDEYIQYRIDLTKNNLLET